MAAIQFKCLHKATRHGLFSHHMISYVFRSLMQCKFFVSYSTTFVFTLWLPPSLTFFSSTNISLWEQFDAVCWSWCGWCEPCNPVTLLQCPRLSLSGLPTPPPPSPSVLSEGQLLWTQTTVPFVLPGLGMHSAIFSCVSASPTGCQTCGPYSYASSSLSFCSLSLCLREFVTVPMSKSVEKGPEKGPSVWLCDSEPIALCTPQSK